ncbi:hypothetical protein LY76DRAFT_588584 [Colletotrichum caudatum]|nr:hypothetical protein LY76DRAFT_588584 [Colletotrichum caudatum]
MADLSPNKVIISGWLSYQTLKKYTERKLQQVLADLAASCPIRQAGRIWAIPITSTSIPQ